MTSSRTCRRCSEYRFVRHCVRERWRLNRCDWIWFRPTQQKKIHWLKVVLLGTKSNRNGLGATVRVHSGGQSYTRYNDGKSGYLSQSVLPLYFGLGDGSKIDSIEVGWPSGRKQVLRKGLTDNQTLKITEPEK